MLKRTTLRKIKNGVKNPQIAKWASRIVSINATTAYTERPSFERMEKNSADEPSRIPAHDLFSMFTADIIKEKTLFTR